MRTAPALVLLLLLLLIGTTGCGDEETDAPAPDAPAPEATWKHVKLTGVKGASGVALIGKDVVLCAGGGERRIFTVPRNVLRDGTTLEPRALRVQLNEAARVAGRELLARRGYTVKSMWEAAIDLQGIGTQRPNHLYVADAAFRIVYWGTLDRDIGGALSLWRLEYAFEVPGAKRDGAENADYRDMGPGLAGMFGVSGKPRTEDVYLVERRRPGDETVASQFRVLVLDRYGTLGGGGRDLGFFTVDVGEDGVPAVEGIARDELNNRFLCVRGEGRGSIAPFKNPGSLRKGKLGAGVPCPDIPGAGRWRGLTVAADGTWFVVSDGSPAILAWRKP